MSQQDSWLVVGDRLVADLVAATYNLGSIELFCLLFLDYGQQNQRVLRNLEINYLPIRPQYETKSHRWRLQSL